MSLRSDAIDAARQVVPSDYGDPAFVAMTGGHFQQGYGSTCGFLASWVLWQIGCRDARIVNRDGALDAEGNEVKYENGANISRLVSGAKALGAWRTFQDAATPCQGDIVFCSNGPASTEHVFVFDQVQGDRWASYDAGKTNDQGFQCARLDARVFNASTGTLGFVNGPRAVQGWVDISALGLPDSSDVLPLIVSGVVALFLAHSLGWLPFPL